MSVADAPLRALLTADPCAMMATGARRPDEDQKR